jgi:hypothetical protein
VQATGIPVEHDQVNGVWEAQVATEHVLRIQLTRMSREQFRAILRDFAVTVRVKRGRSRAEFLAHKTLPIAARVTVEMLGVQVGGDGTNLSSLPSQII